MKPRNVARFAVVSHDGRASGEWRVWTGSGNKTSDETYVSVAALGGELKYSFHSDGTSQHGLGPKVREHLRSDDRRALDRWTHWEDAVPGWRAAIAITFPDSQLAPHAQPGAQALTIPAAGPGRCVILGVVIGGPDAPAFVAPPGIMEVIATLDRANGGQVVLTTVRTNFNEALIEKARGYQADTTAWHLTTPLSEDIFGWTHDVDPKGGAVVMEMWMDRWDVPDNIAPMPPFAGELLPWSQLPVPLPDGKHACGVLICQPDGSARFFVDQAARCDYPALGRIAADLHAKFRAGRLDNGWDRLAGGAAMTTLVSPRHAADWNAHDGDAD